LGYSIADLCLKDEEGKLGQTNFTQPALYVVDCLTYEKKLLESGIKPNYVAGHSLGEYAALYAAECFDFATGLQLIQKRGEIMAKAVGGAMAAVIGMTADKIGEVLKTDQLENIDIANFNSFSQTVLSGKKEDIHHAKPFFEQAGGKFIILNVSGAFHSRYMSPARDEFKAFIDPFVIQTPQIPVIANLTALPYVSGQEKNNLVEQINHSVKWTETIQYLLGNGEQEFVEVGPGSVLTNIFAKIKLNK
jgi:malonyl CoA-acyl carrier protein transacylase